MTQTQNIEGVTCQNRKKTHPWKNGVTPGMEKWAREQSQITNVQTVLVARDKNFKRKDVSKIKKRGAMMMKYEIISSGSAGNCVVIDQEIMVDCGVAFNKIKDYLYDVKYLLLTHIHSDHIKKSTLESIKKLFPRIKIIGNFEVHHIFGVNTIANATFPVKVGDYEFMPFECFHDVLTYGYTWKKDGQYYIYATDTASLENAPNLQYDYFFIESNHDEKKVEQILKQGNKFGYDAYAGAKRHLSTQQAKAFYYLHRRSKESQFIELHKSSRFY